MENICHTSNHFGKESKENGELTLESSRVKLCHLATDQFGHLLFDRWNGKWQISNHCKMKRAVLRKDRLLVLISCRAVTQLRSKTAKNFDGHWRHGRLYVLLPMFRLCVCEDHVRACNTRSPQAAGRDPRKDTEEEGDLSHSYVRERPR